MESSVIGSPYVIAVQDAENTALTIPTEDREGVDSVCGHAGEDRVEVFLHVGCDDIVDHEVAGDDHILSDLLQEDAPEVGQREDPDQALVLVHDGEIRLSRVRDRLEDLAEGRRLKDQMRLFELCDPLRALGFARQVADFFVWAVLAVESCLKLCSTRYVRWRARLYEAVCRSYESVSNFGRARAAARRGLQQVERLQALEALQVRSLFTRL